MKLLRLVIAICGLTCAVSGCTGLTPVYGNNQANVASSMAFQFATPTNRLEQIVYTELARSFSSQGGVEAPLLTVATETSSPRGAMTNTVSVGRFTNSRVTATVTIGEGPNAFVVTRYNDAIYQAGALVLTDTAAATDAQEVAARSAAAALRAAILATYHP